MKAETRKFLFDARQAAGLIERFCHGTTFDIYQQDVLLRSDVER
jgi:hypothetical protein